MSKFPSSKFQGVRALQLPRVSIIQNLGGVLAFFSSFIINNLQKAERVPPETWTIDGAISSPLINPDSQKNVNDSICLLSFLGNTALTQQFQFPTLSGLETFSGWAVDAGLVKTEELAGKLKGQRRLTVYPNPNSIDGEKRVSRARRASPNTAL